MPIDSSDNMKLVRKAFELYQEIEEIKREEEDPVIDLLSKVPINYWIESEPEIDGVRNKEVFNEHVISNENISFQERRR